MSERWTEEEIAVAAYAMLAELDGASPSLRSMLGALTAADELRDKRRRYEVCNNCGGTGEDGGSTGATVRDCGDCGPASAPECDPGVRRIG